MAQLPGSVLQSPLRGSGTRRAGSVRPGTRFRVSHTLLCRSERDVIVFVGNVTCDSKV